MRRDYAAVVVVAVQVVVVLIVVVINVDVVVGRLYSHMVVLACC